MAKWTWEGFSKDGKRAAGQVDAKNEQEVKRALRAMGIRPKKINPPSILEFDLGEWMVDKGIAAPFGANDLSMFTKQLSIMINAGVPILQSLEILGKQQKNSTLRRAVKNIHTKVGEGKTLAESMQEERGFDRLFCNLVKAGEAGGILDQILQKLADHMERQEKTKKQIKSAMTYPGIVTIIGIAVVWGLMVFVVPQFQDMLRDTGQELPLITQLVVSFSKLAQKWTLYVLPLAFVGIVMLNQYRKTPTGKVIFDRFFMVMPLFGSVVVKGNLSSFFRTLSTLITSGVSLVDALDICVEVIDNVVISQDVKSIKKAVIQGKTFTEPLLKISYAPEMIGQMIRVGEQTGAMDSMMAKVSVVLEEEVNGLVENMTKLIEPLVLVVLGGAVAIILVAMYLPIFMAAGPA